MMRRAADFPEISMYPYMEIMPDPKKWEGSTAAAIATVADIQKTTTLVADDPDFLSKNGLQIWIQTA